MVKQTYFISSIANFISILSFYAARHVLLPISFSKEIVMLISDITVNGRLFETAESTKEAPASYFSDIAIMVQGHEIICSHEGGWHSVQSTQKYN